MIKTAGVVLDFYDDQGAALKAKLAGRDVPATLADAEVLDAEKLAALPDNAFAAVIINGDAKLRKYACVDKGNTAASAIYFLENKSKLPGEARIKIAANLVSACRFYDMVIPPDLMKEASGRSLIRGDGAEILVPRKGEKRADLSGTALMPVTAGPPKKRVKTASIIEDPYIDVTGSVMEPARDYAEIDDNLYALHSDDGNHSFPLVSWSQVKTAATFFDEQGKRMHPRTRREFCVKLAARAESLGIEVDDTVRKYGSTTFAPPSDMKVAFEARRQMWRDTHDEAASLLDGLMEKRSELAPSIFAETLAQLDMYVGADRHWGKDIPDPWLSTFGIEKVARWRWVNGADVLTEEQLVEFGRGNYSVLSEHFGDDVAKGLKDKPIQVFESMPLPEKRVIARMAQQQGDGGSAAIM